MKKIVIFASGSGTNAENIIKYFETSKTAKVTAVLTNNATAKVIERASKYGITATIFSQKELIEGEIIQFLQKTNPDLIVLAGFLLKLPPTITQAYPDKIINIHPALLPKYGGKGMYGMNIHNAIITNKEIETGITIHFVNENYDEGAIIFQQKVGITDCQTAEDVAKKIQALEQYHFPEIIEQLITK